MKQMKLYSPKKFQKLYDYKESIEDEEIKQIITELIKNYNKMYIVLRELIQERKNRNMNYKELDRLTIENKELKARLERRELVIEKREADIKELKEKIKEAQKK